MKFTSVFLLVFITCFATLSCSKDSGEKEETQVLKKEYTDEKNEVNIVILKKEPFKEEIISNGKLKAVKKSVLKFKVSGDLTTLNVKEGTYVQKNKTLAVLDGYSYRESLTDAKISLKKSELEFQDMLINRGYDLNKREEIPDKIFEISGLRSGYTEAKQKLNKAEYDLKSTTLFAPFNGKVAEIQYKLYEEVSVGTTFLTLINDTYFEVEFYVTESEVSKVQKNEKVAVFATGIQKNYQGKIIAINPVVGENGTIKIKAKIKNDGGLIEGMNVTVSIEKETPNQFVVPKSAVILRQNQEVLFKVVNGKAFWTYIQIINENKEFYSVIPNPGKGSASLNEGEFIITKGNLNLAHDSEVEVVNKEPSG